jgi:hypothetical protein
MSATTQVRIDELYAELGRIGEQKSREGPGMTRAAYAKLEREEESLKTELRALLDSEAP